MTPKKLIAPVLCLLLGCAGGAAMGGVTAQTWPEPANVQRWQHECVIPGGSGSRWHQNANRVMAERGAQGWDVSGFTAMAVCFKRPAP